MQGNFSYHNPTKLYFGDESLNYLKDELKNFGPSRINEFRYYAYDRPDYCL